MAATHIGGVPDELHLINVPAAGDNLLTFTAVSHLHVYGVRDPGLHTA